MIQCHEEPASSSKCSIGGFGYLESMGARGLDLLLKLVGTYPKSVETLAAISGLCDNFFQLGILATATNSIQKNPRSGS
jgi:hypothetical protein